MQQLGTSPPGITVPGGEEREGSKESVVSDRRALFFTDLSIPFNLSNRVTTVTSEAGPREILRPPV